VDEREWQLMSALARRFYLEDASKIELASEFSISRFRVARLLQQARELGVVTIEIHDHDQPREALAADLADHLALGECVVVKAGDTEEENRRRLARAAAPWIARNVRDGDVVGLSWGRTLVAIGEELPALPPCTVIQLTGTVGNDFRQSPVEVIRRISGRSSVEPMAVFAPLFAASRSAADTFRSDPSIEAALSRYAQLDLAVVAVGSWDPPITQLGPLLTPAERDELEREGVVAEIAGIFFRADGSVIDTDLSQRRISVSSDQLMRTPRVVAAAGSVEKAGAIAAVARSGILTSLVTDDRTANALLRLPRIDAQAHPRRLADGS
jgi:DNA-binding transcriptional regulator LsrR (DeoR family)